MKAIKINVEEKKLEYVELTDDYKDIYKNIGNGCSTFEVPVRLENDDSIFTDEEICLRQDDIKGGFIMENWRYPLLNNGIILGIDDEGDSVDCLSKIEDLEKKIIFVPVDACKKWANIVINTPPTIYTY